MPYLEKKLKTDKSHSIFSVLSDLLILTIKQKEANIAKSIAGIFYLEFKKIRENAGDSPVIYPVKYYETVYKAIEELAILKEKRNYFLEHRTAGAVWLLGEETGKTISEETYQWLWQNLLHALRYEQDDLIISHWQTCHNYYWLNFYSLQEEYSYDLYSYNSSPSNATTKQGFEEGDKFLEFHYALGGLLMYKNRFKCIKRIFDFTLSEPPQYYLLPSRIEEILKFFSKFQDTLSPDFVFITNKYPFPELDGVKADTQIQKWILHYISVLFIRQYTITPYLSLNAPLDFPGIPKSQRIKKEWLNAISSMKRIVEELLNNNEMLLALNFDFITKEWCKEKSVKYPLELLDELETKIKQEYNKDEDNLQISSEKAEKFFQKTKEILEATLDKLKVLDNPTINQSAILSIKDQFDIYRTTGARMIQYKEIFSAEPTIDYINYDSILAERVSQNINENYAQTFLFKTTKAYIIKPESLFEAAKKIITGTDSVIINFGIFLDYHINSLEVNDLNEKSYYNFPIYTFQNSHLVNNSLFILNKHDLPVIYTEDIKSKIKDEYSLRKLGDKYDLYSNVIDLNGKDNDFLKKIDTNTQFNELKKYVLLCIYINMEILWKKNVQVTRIIQYSEYSNKGIVNSLDDIK